MCIQLFSGHPTFYVYIPDVCVDVFIAACTYCKCSIKVHVNGFVIILR